jgi:peptidoglycan hydrolase-like protein with peptidoglycan-binding domain
MRGKLVILVVTFAFVVPNFSAAATLAELQAQLQGLMAQIAALTAQQGTVAAPQSGAASCPNLYRTLFRGSLGNDVKQLQQFLINQNHLGAGNNTGYFGLLTEAAVKQFQCKHMSICSGFPKTTGYGLVGPATRAKIAAVCSASPVTPSPEPLQPVPPPPTVPPPAPTPTPTPPTTPSSVRIDSVRDEGVQDGLHYLALLGSFPSSFNVSLSCTSSGTNTLMPNVTYKASNQVNISFPDVTVQSTCAVSITDSTGTPVKASIAILPNSLRVPEITSVAHQTITEDGKHYYTLLGTFKGTQDTYTVTMICNGKPRTMQISYFAYNQINAHTPNTGDQETCVFRTDRSSDGARSNEFTLSGIPLDMRLFWPQPNGQVYITRFDSGRVNYYRRATDGTFVLSEYWDLATLQFNSNWHYKIDSRGMNEFTDDYPESPGSAVAKPGVPFLDDYSIKWGKFASVGETFVNHKVVSQLQKDSLRPFAWQKIKFLQYFPTYVIGGTTYENVVRLHVYQQICLNNTVASIGTHDVAGPLDCPQTAEYDVEMYFAPGKGFLKFDNVKINSPGVTAIPREDVVKICTVPATKSWSSTATDTAPGQGEVCPK